MNREEVAFGSGLRAQGSGLLPPAPSPEPTARWAFSLIEVIISLAILSVGVFGAMRVFPVGLRASQRSELISRASLLAERTMESLKLESWDQLVDTGPVQEEPFEIRVSVDQPSVEGLADPSRLKRLVVTVSWMQEGRPRTLELISYVRRPAS